MKVCVLNADSFVGSNFCNYLVQYTKNDVVGILNQSPSYAHLQASISSKQRFSYQVCVSSEKNDPSIKARIDMENPDVILVIEQVLPAFLEGDKRTIFIGRDYNQIDCYRQFLYSESFGPRKSVKSLLTKQILRQEGLQDPIQVLYIKDLFDEAMQFVSSNSRFGAATGLPINQFDLDTEEPTTKMQVAIAHTRKWYEANKWFNL